jgi:hypothetical protein
LWVLFDPFSEAQIISAYCQWLNAANFAIPRLNHIHLRLAIADQPLAASPGITGKRK